MLKTVNRFSPIRLTELGVSSRHEDVTWDECPVADRLRPWCESIEDHVEQGEGLSLHGRPGTGKTSVLVLVVKRCLELAHARDQEGNGGLRYTVPEVRLYRMSDLFDALHNGEKEVSAEARRCSLLLLDDIGTEYASEFALSQFQALIDWRYGERKSTIITTNLIPRDLDKRPGWERMADRFAETNEQVEMRHSSLRRRPKGGTR